MASKRLFVDMDGTLAEWRTFKYEFTSLEDVQNASKLIYEKLNEDGYFYNLNPQESVVEAIREIVKQDNNIEVFILSAAISDKAIEDKNKWLDNYLPEIDTEHRIFTEDGKDKKEFILGGVRPDDYLLDDRSANLFMWEPPAKGIKLLNGNNASKGTWKSDMLSFERSSAGIAESIVSIINDGEHVRDKIPRNSYQTIEIEQGPEDFDDLAKLDVEMDNVRNQYMKIITDKDFKAFQWEDSFTGNKYIFHKSASKDDEWQLSTLGNFDIPLGHSTWKTNDIGTGTIDDVIYQFPYSRPGRSVKITALFDSAASRRIRTIEGVASERKIIRECKAELAELCRSVITEKTLENKLGFVENVMDETYRIKDEMVKSTPWRPSDIKQREDRISRQGNENKPTPRLLHMTSQETQKIGLKELFKKYGQHTVCDIIAYTIARRDYESWSHPNKAWANKLVGDVSGLLEPDRLLEVKSDLLEPLAESCRSLVETNLFKERTVRTVAVESTKDYEDPAMRFTDGINGETRYRLVYRGEDQLAHVYPTEESVFQTKEDVESFIEAEKQWLNVIPYDELKADIQKAHMQLASVEHDNTVEDSRVQQETRRESFDLPGDLLH